MDEPDKVNLTPEFLQNTRALAEKARHSPWSSSPQDGEKGHCLMAQVFDENGHALAEIEPTLVPAQASDDAAHIANMHPAVVIAMVDEIEKMRGAKPWRDQPDQFTARVNAVHPVMCKDEDRHSRYALAMKMISNRHGKYELVNLINWLLTKWPELQSEATQ